MSSAESRYACLSCRQRKLKCDRKQPCSNCTARSVDCRQQELQSTSKGISRGITKSYEQSPGVSDILSRLDRLEAYIHREQEQENDGGRSRPSRSNSNGVDARRIVASPQTPRDVVITESASSGNELPGAEGGHLVGVSTNEHALVRGTFLGHWVRYLIYPGTCTLS